MMMPMPTNKPFPTLPPRTAARSPCPLTPKDRKRVIRLRRKLSAIRKRSPCVKFVCQLKRRFDRTKKCILRGKGFDVFNALIAKCRMRKSVIQQINEQRNECRPPMGNCDKAKIRKLLNQRQNIIKACLKLGRANMGRGNSTRCPSLKKIRGKLFAAKKRCRSRSRNDFDDFFTYKMQLFRIKRCNARPSNAPRRW